MYHYQSCYRLFAGVDALLCIFTFSAWSLTFFRAQNLVQLQFEHHDDPRTFLEKISEHQLILRSAGTNDSPELAADQLRDIYETIHRDCAHFYKTTKPSPKLQQDITLFLQIEVITMLAVAGAFSVFDLVAIISTWHRKTGHKNVALALFILQTTCSLLFIGCGMAFTLDPKFCALKDIQDPMHGPVWIFTVIYKPYHLYLIFKYYKEVLNHKIHFDESESSSTSYSSVTPPPSPNTLKQATHKDAYEFDKSLGVPNDETKGRGSTDDNANEILLPNVHRKHNVTNIPAASDQRLNTPVEQANPRRILGWGMGKNSRSRKVYPSK